MKIAWFSPLPPILSGISEYSEVILFELKKHAQIDLWVDGFLPRSDFYKNFKIFDYFLYPEILPALKTYDTIIYNMGNNANYHSGIHDVLENYPGFVILHDYVLHHFFSGYWLLRKKDPETYLQGLRLLYGFELEKIARNNLQAFLETILKAKTVFHYPYNEKILKQATGLIVHSEFVKKLVQVKTSVKIVQLNSPTYPIPISSLTKNRTDLALPEDKIIVVSLGDQTRNKKLEMVLDTISKSDFLSKNILYLIIGTSNESYSLDEDIAKYKLDSQVKSLGYLPIEKVYVYMNCANFCINLRNPTMGETSASLIRMMSLGKPTLVSNVGWYSELPNETVIKIDPENEKTQLTNWMIRLVKEPGLRQKIGNEAQNYILKNHHSELFVKGLMNFLESTFQLSKKNLYLNLVDKVTDILSDMNQNSESLFSNIAQELAWLPNPKSKINSIPHLLRISNDTEKS